MGWKKHTSPCYILWNKIKVASSYLILKWVAPRSYSMPYEFKVDQAFLTRKSGTFEILTPMSLRLSVSLDHLGKKEQ